MTSKFATIERPKTEKKEDKKRMPNKITVYLAGPLFGIADRHHNLLLARELEQFGFEVILPQKEALKFFKDGKFDLKAVCKNCFEGATKSDVVVANIDGPSADDGTAIEVGMAISKQKNQTFPGRLRTNPLVICVRTDFRTASDREVGINAMFRLANKIIEKPAYANSLEDVEKFYEMLAYEIYQNIVSQLII
ncbi:MAG: nucleoside 2-deoxyribosyltransferase [Patescibacteria group bacterium]